MKRTKEVEDVWEHVKQTDPELYDILIGELKRQEFGIELIASENFASLAVIEAM